MSGTWMQYGSYTYTPAKARAEYGPDADRTVGCQFLDSVKQLIVVHKSIGVLPFKIIPISFQSLV